MRSIYFTDVRGSAPDNPGVDSEDPTADSMKQGREAAIPIASVLELVYRRRTPDKTLYYN
jgi:hypothetical protein